MSRASSSTRARLYIDYIYRLYNIYIVAHDIHHHARKLTQGAFQTVSHVLCKAQKVKKLLPFYDVYARKAIVSKGGKHTPTDWGYYLAKAHRAVVIDGSRCSETSILQVKWRVLQVKKCHVGLVWPQEVTVIVRTYEWVMLDDSTTCNADQEAAKQPFPVL